LIISHTLPCSPLLAGSAQDAAEILPYTRK
jgi:hypothetical protein